MWLTFCRWEKWREGRKLNSNKDRIKTRISQPKRKSSLLFSTTNSPWRLQPTTETSCYPNWEWNANLKLITRWRPFNIKSLSSVFPWALAILRSKVINYNNFIWTFKDPNNFPTSFEKLPLIFNWLLYFLKRINSFKNHKSYSLVKNLLIIMIVNSNQNTSEYQNPSRNKERKPL